MNKLIIFLVFIILSCNNTSEKENNTTQKKVKEEVHINNDALNVIELGQNESMLEFSIDESENVIILQTKKNNEIVSIVGCGNSEFVKREDGSIIVDTLNFSTDKESYLVSSFIKGSTYGAECYYIVFKKSQWIVMALPFDRARFYDTDQDGLDEIIEYKSKTDSTIYTFNLGLVLPKKS